MLRVMVVGLGPIGVGCARAVRADAGLKLVGLVDADPGKVGRGILDLTGPPDAAETGGEGLAVVSDIDQVTADADVAVVATTSWLDRVAPQLRKLLGRGVAVVSSCEQMLWPWYAHPVLAKDVDAEAKRAGRALLGTGVNPGYVMDALAVSLSSIVRRVKLVRCVRRGEASVRRRPLQAKIGATLSADEFGALARAGKIGHMGIAESVALLAAGLGCQVPPGSVTVTLEPVLAEQPMQSALGLIEPGQVTGIHNTAQWQNERLRVELDLTMAVGTPDPIDVVELEGPVHVRLKIPGGLPGDSATVAAMINHLRVVHEARPGLLTMLDVPIAGCRGQDPAP